MMKLKHLLALAAIAVGSSAWAQTDVTSQYLVNADFEGNYEAMANSGVSSDRAIYQPEGWTVVLKGTNVNDMSILSSGDKASNNFAGFTINHSGEHTYWVRHRWGGKQWQSNGNHKGQDTALELQQEVTLPAGIYTISADMIHFSAGSEANNFAKMMIGNRSVTADFYRQKNDGGWKNYSMTYFSDGTPQTLSLRAEQNWTNESIVGFDDVKIVRFDVDADHPYDMTYMASNTKDAWGGTNTYGDGFVEKYYEQHYTGPVMSQTLEGLPKGKYRVEIQVQAHCADWNCTAIPEAAGATDRTVLTVNNVEQGIPVVNDKGFLPDEPTTYAIEDIVVIDGNLKFAIENKKEGANWITVKILKIEYLGTDDSVKDEYIANIQSALENIPEGKMNAGVASNLSAKISAAQAATNAMSQDELETILSELNDAKAAANASIAEYTTINDAIGNVDNVADYTPLASNQEAYTNVVNAAKSNAQTAYDEGTADANTVKTLNAALQAAKETANIADFKYAKDTYTEEIAVNWENTNQKGQHWDGTATGYYDTWNSTATNVSKSAKVTLAPGNYILKAAGRGQAGTTTYIKVGDVQVNFTNKGDAGKGIDTDGNANFSDGTFANGAGRGWEWRFIEFTLEEETEVTLTCGYDLNAGTWASVCVPELYADEASIDANELLNAKNALLVEIGKVVVPTANIGDATFQYPTDAIETINATIDNAKEVAENAETLAEVNDAKAAIAAIKIPALNAPAAGQKFHLNLKDRGIVTFIQNPAVQSGYGIPFMSKESDNYAQAFALIPVESEENDMYIMSFKDYDGETRYICNGIPYSAGTGAYGIRTITDKDKALVIKVVATAEEGVYNLMNTSTNGGYKKLGSNGGDFYTDDKYSNFTITVAQQATATLAISDAQYGTFIAPFDAVVPAGVTVYTCAEVDGNTLTLEPATTIKANTAYIVYAEESVSETLTGWGLATKDAYETGVLTGSYELAPVAEGKYLLQNNNNKVGFYLVAEDGFKIGANRCYLTAPETAEEGKAFYFDNATAIEAINALAAGNVKAIYNAAGAAQKNLVRGLNIVKTADGKIVKVMVK